MENAHNDDVKDGEVDLVIRDLHARLAHLVHLARS